MPFSTRHTFIVRSDSHLDIECDCWLLALSQTQVYLIGLPLNRRSLGQPRCFSDLPLLTRHTLVRTNSRFPRAEV